MRARVAQGEAAGAAAEEGSSMRAAAGTHPSAGSSCGQYSAQRAAQFATGPLYTI